MLAEKKNYAGLGPFEKKLKWLGRQQLYSRVWIEFSNMGTLDLFLPRQGTEVEILSSKKPVNNSELIWW